MEGDVVSDLVWQLAVRIFPGGNKGGENGSNGQQKRQGDAAVRRAHQYAMRIIGSRISPSLANDEAAMAEAIKRQLVQENRSADALSFADLHRRISSYSGPGAIENRWALLYLLRAIAEDQRRERAETRGTAIPFTSTLSGCFVFSSFVLQSEFIFFVALQCSCGGISELNSVVFQVLRPMEASLHFRPISRIPSSQIAHRNAMYRLAGLTLPEMALLNLNLGHNLHGFNRQILLVVFLF